MRKCEGMCDPDGIVQCRHRQHSCQGQQDCSHQSVQQRNEPESALLDSEILMPLHLPGLAVPVCGLYSLARDGSSLWCQPAAYIQHAQQLAIQGWYTACALLTQWPSLKGYLTWWLTICQARNSQCRYSKGMTMMAGSACKCRLT